MASRPLSHLLRQQRGVSLLRCRQRMLSSQQPEPAASSESLIPTTLAEMEADIGDSEGVSATLAAIKKVGQARLTREDALTVACESVALAVVFAKGFSLVSAVRAAQGRRLSERPSRFPM